ncbi:hypothetical protein D3C79_791510 [compost metagenome]
MGIGVPGGVGVGDGDVAYLLPSQGHLFLARFFVIEQAVGEIRVAVRPTVDGDRLHVLLVIEPDGPQHGLQLIADHAFHLLETHGVELGAPDTGLAARVHSSVGGGRHVDHVQADRLVRVARMAIAADVHRVVQFHPAVGLVRRVDFVHPQLHETLPVADYHLGVNQWELHVLRQRVGLFGGQVAQ